MKPKRLILVSDDPKPLTLPNGNPVSHDASAEWEDEKTIAAIAAGWEDAGWSVEPMTVKPGFLPAFTNCLQDPILVHSLTEGWGSTSREAWIPSLCELAGVPWIGSAPFGLTICMDKDAVSAICHQLSIPAPSGFLIRSQQDYAAAAQQFRNTWHFVKPNAEGSGMGIERSSIRPPGVPLEATRIAELLQRYPDGLRAETALTGTEYTAALVGNPPEFLPIVQIDVDGGVYGLENKQKDVMTERLSFPRISDDVHDTIRTGCIKLWERLQLKDFCRFDWKCDETDHPHLIDINPLAGLSPYYSVLPKIWEHTGRSFPQLLATLAESAASKVNDRSLFYGQQRSKRQEDR
jgi:D-alanine-D-alanine ligase